VFVTVGVNVLVEVDAGVLLGAGMLVGVFVVVAPGTTCVCVAVGDGAGIDRAVPTASWVSMTSCGGVIPSREEKVTPSLLSATSANV